MGEMRNKINAIVEGKLYQRGQILSWKRGQKEELIKELEIDVVVNFWPKLDADMSDMPCWYWYIPSESTDMLENQIIILAKMLARLIMKHGFTALILCEAGKTRSVFFTGLVMHFMKIDNVVEELEKVLPGHRMKPYMIEYLETLG